MSNRFILVNLLACAIMGFVFARWFDLSLSVIATLAVIMSTATLLAHEWWALKRKD